MKEYFNIYMVIDVKTTTDIDYNIRMLKGAVESYVRGFYWPVF